MSIQKVMKLLLLVCSLLAISAVQAQPTSHVRVDLVAAVTSIAPGDTFEVVFRQQIDDEWHTYWTNPGDSGAAPDIKWTVPDGVLVSAFKYPYPERIPYGPLMNYGYHNEVLMPFSVSVPEDYPDGVVDIKGTGRVLVCADICIPEKVEVQLSMPIGPTVVDGAVSDTFYQAHARVPQRAGARRARGAGRARGETRQTGAPRSPWRPPGAAKRFGRPPSERHAEGRRRIFFE